MDANMMLTLAATTLVALAMLSLVWLKGFSAWLDLKRAELDMSRDTKAPPSASNRIELADLKERLRKLEAIAAGVDL